MVRRVVLVPYDEAWPARFEAAREAILAACNGLVKEVEHVGSTAVPGLAAKDVVDLMPMLTNFADGERCVAPMAELGFVYRGEYGIPGRHFFVKDDPATGERLHNVHMYQEGHDEWVAHLAFRDYLRAHDDWRDRYERLKRDLAAKYPDDVEAYAEAKTDFVKEAVALRLAEVGSDHVYQRVR